MGTTCTTARSDQRNRTYAAGSDDRRQIPVPHWREIVCDGEKEFRMRRHQEFLLSSREGTPTGDYGNRATNCRVEDTVGTRLTHSSQPPDIGQRNPVLGAAELLHRRDVCNMQPVSYGDGKNVCFNDTVTVRYMTEWSPASYRAARTGPWLEMAKNRRCFERKIRTFENE